MSQPVQSTKIEAVVNKPAETINKVEEASKLEEKAETKTANEVQVAQKSLNDVSRNENEAVDTWGLTKKYNIQKYVLPMKGSMRILLIV